MSEYLSQNTRDWIGILLRVIGYMGGFMLLLFIIRFIVRMII